LRRFGFAVKVRRRFSKDLALLRLRAELQKRQFMIGQKNGWDLIRKNGIVNPIDP
jgi:hypothetical protein